MYMFYPCIAVMEFVISGYMFYRFGQTGSNTSLGWAVFAFGIGILAFCLQVALMYDKTFENYGAAADKANI